MFRYLSLLLTGFFFLFGSTKAVAEPVPLRTLTDVIRHALEHSPELKAARAELKIAEIAEPLFLSDLDTQIEAGYKKSDDQSPRAVPAFEGTRTRAESFNVDLVQKTLLGTEARVSWLNQRIDSDAPFRILNPSTESTLSIGIEQNLMRYVWGRPDVSRRKRYRAGALSALESTRQKATDVAALAAHAAFDLQFAERRVVIAEESVSAAKKLVQSYDEKKRFGMVEESDLLQASASLEAEQTELLLAHSSLKTAQHALAVYIGADVPVSLSTSSVIQLTTEKEAGTVESALSKAVASRGDVKALKAAAEAAEWAARSEKLETLPQISLNASYGVAGLGRSSTSAQEDMESRDHPVRSVGVNLVAPLWYRKEKLLRNSKKLELELARQNFEAGQDRVEREVRDAWEILHMSRERLAARIRLADLQRRKYQAERDNLRRGRSTTDVVVRFLQEVNQSEVALVRARIDEQAAEIELARATGTLLSALGIEDAP